MRGRCSAPLFVMGISFGLSLFDGGSVSWGQTCPVTHGCSTAILSGAEYATIGGGWVNVIGSGGDYATVGGGRQNSATAFAVTVSGGRENSATVSFATVGGGYSNAATAYAATVGGGNNNEASRESATVGGGAGNTVNANNATVGGGTGNAASGASATVGGGYNNEASGTIATVGGGYNNTAQGSRATVSGGVANLALGYAAAIPGGYNNRAGGNFSFAAGRQAQAKHTGAFVWADANTTAFPSTHLNQFNVRASGGTRIFSNAAATVGVRLAPGSNAWSIASDRTLKEDFQDIDKQQVLAGVQQLTIQNWKLKEEAGNVRHVGPVAQDFHAAFQLGGDERFIHTGDAVGVSLVAIQALAEQNQALGKRNRVLEQQVEELQQHNTLLQMQMSRVLHQVDALVQERQSGRRREAALAE